MLSTIEFSSFQLFHRLKWMPFEERVNFKRSVLMYKCINGLTPDYLQNFRYLSHQHFYNTRAAARNNLSTTRASLTTFTRSFKVDGERLWNALPSNIREASTTRAFKSMYMNHYFKHIGS